MASALEKATAGAGQASLHDAFADFFQARNYLQRNQMEIAINFCNSAIEKFQGLSQPPWEAKSKSLLYDAKRLDSASKINSKKWNGGPGGIDSANPLGEPTLLRSKNFARSLK